MNSFDKAQENYDNRLPIDDDPDVPEYLILQVCQEWAENPPDWMREKAEEHWLELRRKAKAQHPWRK